jgi:arylsulfatase A-like enzyme
VLDELKLADNTVLIFTSDNGGVGGYTREGIMKGGKGDITDNAPLRSGKGSLYEGGTRVPFIVRWPGVTKAGSSCDVPTIHVDVLPHARRDRPCGRAGRAAARWREPRAAFP